MKQHLWLSTTFIFVAILVAMLFTFGDQGAVANRQRLQPTVAPTAIPGALLPLPTLIPLAQPLTTKEQALEQVLYYDASIAVWSRPWSKETMTLEPDRITIETYPSLSAESVAHGFKGESPEVDVNSGPVWIVTIKGDVHLMMITPYDSSNVIYDGVTYVISQRTGYILEIRSGLPKK
jgi:hypothetical protein